MDRFSCTVLRDWWEKWTAENGITWEIGPPKPRDQHGREYVTLYWTPGDLQPLRHFLRTDKHVIIRVLPTEEVQLSSGAVVRCRLTCYPHKPEVGVNG